MGHSEYWKIEKTLSEKDFLNLQQDFSTLQDWAWCVIKPEKGVGWIDFFHHKSDNDLEEHKARHMCIAFNGEGKDAHETFVLGNHGKGRNEFCKTAQKPYSEMVTGLLLWAKYKHPEWIIVRTDGIDDDWKMAQSLIRRAMNVDLDIFITEDAEVIVSGSKEIDLNEPKELNNLVGCFS